MAPTSARGTRPRALSASRRTERILGTKGRRRVSGRSHLQPEVGKASRPGGVRTRDPVSPGNACAGFPAELPMERRVERSFDNSRARNTTSITIRGVPIGVDQVDRRRRKVCPACLEESRHHRFWWDFVAVTTCPRHKLRLVDRCGCGSDTLLTWKDANLFYCGDCSRNVPLAASRRIRASWPPRSNCSSASA